MMRSGYLYFRPKQSRPITMDDVRAWGLGYAFEASPHSCNCIANTPTGGSGMLFADKGRHEDGRVKMDMEAQEWRKMPRPGQEDIHIGFWKDHRPGPDDLRRASQLSGYRIPLADGKQWLVPTVRYFDESVGELRSNLPSYIDVDENGSPVVGQVMPLYAHLWDITAPFVEQMLSDEGGPDTTVEEIRQTAKVLLQANYVMDWIEIAQSQILTTEQLAHNIVAVAVDWPTYLNWRETLKKSASPVTAGS